MEKEDVRCEDEENISSLGDSFRSVSDCLCAQMPQHAHKTHIVHDEVNSWVSHMGDPRASTDSQFPPVLPAV